MGKRIVEQEQNGNERAQYGQALIDALADELTKEYGKSFSKRNLQYFRKFYIAFPDERIVNACVHNLTWTHFRSLLRVPDENARLWYMNEASNEGWSSRTLDRNISTQYFYRLMQSPKKNDVVNEMLLKNSENQKNQFELLKSPIVAEFLGFKNEDSYIESDLESAVIGKMQKFLLELGKGFLFEQRQKRFTFNDKNFYVDLVLYNRLLRCYVLIDFKIDELTHQDLGQMQMYVNYYDRYEKIEGENPTIGILLCKQSDEALVDLTLPENANIYAKEYKLYLPDKKLLQKKLKEWLDEEQN